jgi:hypothetical protein
MTHILEVRLRLIEAGSTPNKLSLFSNESQQMFQVKSAHSKLEVGDPALCKNLQVVNNVKATSEGSNILTWNLRHTLFTLGSIRTCLKADLP